ncbi:hypothetical protein ABG067_005852 [Albugo candida]
MSWLKNKIKLVATKAQDAIIQGIDAMVPTLYDSDVKEFHQRWLTVRHFMDAVSERNITDMVEQKRILHDSSTPESLQKMVMMLCTEEKSVEHLRTRFDVTLHTNSEESMQSHRPCLEYLLENQIVPYLCDIGKRNQPRGIMPLSLQFISAILEKLEYPVLPTREIHVAIIALAKSAIVNEIDDILTRKCMIRLLYSIWKKLRSNPVQIEFFFVYSEANEYDTDLKNTAEASKIGDEGNNISELIIFSGLLPHMYADGVIGDRCRETMIIAAGIPEASLVHFILHLTPFCHEAISGLVAAYDALPRNFIGRKTNERLDAANLQHSKSRYLNIFISRLRFCCSLVMTGSTKTLGTEPKSISTVMAQLFSDLFLKSTFLPALLSASEPSVLATTLYARIIMEELGTFGRDVECNPFLLLFCQALLDQSMDASIVPKESSRSVFFQLIGRIDSLSSSLSIATMDLIAFMLELDNPLIDSWLLDYPPGDPRMVAEESNEISCESMKQARQHEAVWFASHFPNSSIASHVHLWKTQGFSKHMEIGDNPEIVSSGESENSKHQVVSILSYIVDAEYMATRRIPTILEASFMSEEKKTDCARVDRMHSSSHTTEEDTSEDLPRSENHSIPVDATTSTKNVSPMLQSIFTSFMSEEEKTDCARVDRMHSSSHATEEDTSEDLPRSENHSIPVDATTSTKNVSPMLQSIFSKLERLLEHSFLENLSLSGLVSILSQKTNLVDAVFDFQDIRDGQSIRSILEKVHRDASNRLSGISDGAFRLEEVRQSLKNNDSSLLTNQEPEPLFLCGFVMLDEILKEMCSFLFAMERAQSLPLKPEGFYMEPNTQMTFSQIQDNSILESERELGRVESSLQMSKNEEAEVDLGTMIIEAEAIMSAMLNSGA